MRVLLLICGDIYYISNAHMIQLYYTFDSRFTASLTGSLLLDWCTIYYLLDTNLTAKLTHLLLHYRCEVYYKFVARLIYCKFDARFITNLMCDQTETFKKYLHLASWIYLAIILLIEIQPTTNDTHLPKTKTSITLGYI
jgi:hypothetical protein